MASGSLCSPTSGALCTPNCSLSRSLNQFTRRWLICMFVLVWKGHSHLFLIQPRKGEESDVC